MKVFTLADKYTGEITFEGVEANRNLPCWVCEHAHKTPSWCLVDAQRRVCICQRIQSERRVGDAGWWHGQSSTTLKAIQGNRQPHSKPFLGKKPIQSVDKIEWTQLWATCKAACKPEDVVRLHRSLGLPLETILHMEVGNYFGAWAFAMRDIQGLMCGIKLRYESGKKVCVTGSNLGLVYPTTYRQDDRNLCVTEGESDCMVASRWGMNTVGKPSCSSCRNHVAAIAKRKDVIIIADRDDAGKAGALDLKRTLAHIAKSCTIILPPCKDLRMWAQQGATQNELHWLIKSVRGY